MVSCVCVCVCVSACLRQRTILSGGDDEERPGSVGTESSSSTVWRRTTLIKPSSGIIQSTRSSPLNVSEEVKVIPTTFFSFCFLFFWNDACNVKL